MKRMALIAVLLLILALLPAGWRIRSPAFPLQPIRLRPNAVIPSR